MNDVHLVNYLYQVCILYIQKAIYEIEPHTVAPLARDSLCCPAGFKLIAILSLSGARITPVRHQAYQKAWFLFLVNKGLQKMFFEINIYPLYINVT